MLAFEQVVKPKIAKEQNVLRTICNIVRLNFVDSGNYETINIIHNKPSGIISWLIKKDPNPQVEIKSI